tara:strand:+ start:614 stop:850 length:237 start_codon:yes stop_codon:yes gene_type:complete
MNKKILAQIRNSSIEDLRQFYIGSLKYDYAIEIMSHRSVYPYRKEWEYTVHDVRIAELQAKRGIKAGSDLFTDAIFRK